MGHFIRRSILVWICVTIMCANLYSQTVKKCCNNSVKIGYINPPPGTEARALKVSDTSKKEISIIFESGFNDTVVVFLNEKIQGKVFLKSNENRGYTGENMLVDYSKIKKGKKLELKVQSLNRSACIEIEIQKGYRMLELSWSKETWWANFSNYGQVFE
jgi:hypothetical protein